MRRFDGYAASTDPEIEVEIRVSYDSIARPEEIASVLATANRRAFEEIEVRVGPLPEVEA